MSDGAAPRQHPLAVALHEALSQHRDAVLQAPTGAGKSTIVPLALLQQDLAANKKILMLEPRRLAARAVAARMASTLGERVGDTVGYRMRLDTRVSAATRIEVVTEGVLTRMLQDDPTLNDVAFLIFDEFHERSLAADLGLALALDARRHRGAAFRLLIMSATIEGEKVAALLGDAALVSVPGRAFPVEIHYLGRALPLLPGGTESPERAVALAVRRALTDSSGDVLVFLPGVGEIRRVEGLLREAGLPPRTQLLSLFGQMEAGAQDSVLSAATPGARKVVLATNIAETSLTIPGVTAVVDSGLMRRSRFDPVTGMSSLELMRISRAASEQRAGRAGRVAPGVCYRLWSAGSHGSLAAATAAEILDADLAPLALDLARWGTPDAAGLQWLDAPPAPTLQQARQLLQRLDAIDAEGELTAPGRDMSRLPLHPRLAHMLLAAREPKVLERATQLAALLSERDLLHRGAGSATRDPDIRTRLDLLRPGQSGGADRFMLERVQRSAQALASAVRALGGKASAQPSLIDAADDVGALLSLAFPDRIGRRREGAAGRYLLANGRGAAFAGPVSLAREQFIVALELDDRPREARIDLAAPLSQDSLERLFAEHIVTEETIDWDARAGALLARRVRRFEALVLEEQVQPPPNSEQTTAAMLAALAQLGLESLPWDDEARALRARMQFVGSLGRADLRDWPASDDAVLMASLPVWLSPYLDGVTRSEHLSRLPLIEALRARLNRAQQRALDTLAPREVAVPSGSRIRIDYLDDNAPCVSVRLQEVFGLTETPRIGANTVPLTFKLLSPAQRPLQITRDLAGFWRSSYFEVRKQMRGRYPKHPWPENPLEAPPTRGRKR